MAHRQSGHPSEDSSTSALRCFSPVDRSSREGRDRGVSHRAVPGLATEKLGQQRSPIRKHDVTANACKLSNADRERLSAGGCGHLDTPPLPPHHRRAAHPHFWPSCQSSADQPALSSLGTNQCAHPALGLCAALNIGIHNKLIRCGHSSFNWSRHKDIQCRLSGESRPLCVLQSKL